MAKIEKNKIDKILDCTHIEDVIEKCLGTYGRNNPNGLRKKGIRYEALCPFHDDKTMGSFKVYPAGNCYKCFSCGEKGGAVDFLMKHEGMSYPDAIRWLGKLYNIDVDDETVNWTFTPRPAPPPLPILTLPMSMVQNTLVGQGKDDNLVNYIRTGIRWDYVQRHRIDEVLKDYNVGHGKNGHTIFWQLDERGMVRTGKMMKYRADGHRDKVSAWNFDFIHSIFERGKPMRDEYGRIMKDEHGETIYDTNAYRHIYDPDRQEATLTYYGMHLLNRYPNATIKLVESEKTALLMAIAYGNHPLTIWMACGGLEMISRDRLKPLIDQRRKIVLYPDRDGIDKWRVKAEQMHYDNLSLDDEPVTRWWREGDGPKADIADVVIRMLNTSREFTNIQDVAQAMPQVQPLINNLKLEITNG
jgi:hypothetical protein